MGAIIYSFNQTFHLKHHMVVLECDSYVTELHACDIIIKDFVIKKGELFMPDPVFGSTLFWLVEFILRSPMIT